MIMGTITRVIVYVIDDAELAKLRFANPYAIRLLGPYRFYNSIKLRLMLSVIHTQNVNTALLTTMREEMGREKVMTARRN